VLAAGAAAPDFEGQSYDGRTLRLSALRGKPVVLYFYPKSFTPICTVETRRFRDSYPDLVALGAEVVGVSADDLGTQCDFAREQRIEFPLLADPERRICSAYGVLWPIIARARRVTFLIDEQGVIEHVTWHEFQVSKHLDDVLLHLQKRGNRSAPGR
jgi:thioredoxin-dependent peroxiredoxin